MFTVALIGPDGVGKTTIGRRLPQVLPLRAKYLYMGVDLYSSNHMLPSSRVLHAIKRACGGKKDTAGPQDSSAAGRPAKGVLRRVVGGVKANLSLANRIAEEWYRQGLAWYYKRRRYLVVFDRHYFPDYYAYDVARHDPSRPLHRRIHGFLLKHFYPRPDLMIYLDAPAEVLLARKGEGTLQSLQRRRGEYLQMRELVDHFIVVDASRPLEDVVQEVTQRISEFYQIRTGNPAEVRHVPNPIVQTHHLGDGCRAGQRDCDHSIARS